MTISSDNNSYAVCDGCWLSFQQAPDKSNNKNLCTSCEQEQNNDVASDDNDTHVSKSYDITNVLESNSNDSDDDNSDWLNINDATSTDDEPQIDMLNDMKICDAPHSKADDISVEKSTSTLTTSVVKKNVNEGDNSYAVCDGCWLSFEQLSSTKLCLSCEQNDNVLSVDVSKSRDNVTCDDKGAKTNSVSCGATVGNDDIVLEDIDMPETCANCGKEAGEGCHLNSCNRCKLVKYCNAACKKKHRSKHKKKCDRRASELHDEMLFKEHPPNEECPICLIPMPHEEGLTIFRSCCGKTICHGCVFGISSIEVEKLNIDELRLGQAKMPESPCPFCRAHLATGIKQVIKQTEILAKNGIAEAYYNLGIKYAKGKSVSKDYTKANAWWLKGGQLGCAAAYDNLGNSYLKGLGVAKNEKKAKYYFELAAMGGSVPARHNLGTVEIKDEESRAMKHFVLAAKAGYKPSLDFVLKCGFMKGLVTKDEYANTLRAYQDRHELMKSKERTKAADFERVVSFCKEDPKFKRYFQGHAMDLFGFG